MLATADISWHYQLLYGASAPLASFTNSCTNLVCTFDGSASNSKGTVASYAWNFGDGTTGTGATPSHTYTANGSYTVTLTTTGTLGGTAAASTQVSVLAANKLPVAAFKPYCAALVCNFDGSLSTDPDGTLAAYAWDFGDSATSTSQNPAHTYSAPGTYTIILTVTDDRAGTNTKTASVVVPTTNSYPATVKADGAIPQWRFEQTSGTTIADSGEPPPALPAMSDWDSRGSCPGRSPLP
ncbi:PKD domain-containing protein [Arthrobacter alpinus]|nr:PKD domain-containing protein [Arthrobacter alpinus]